MPASPTSPEDPSTADAAAFSVHPRAGARTDGDVLRLVGGAAVKVIAFPSHAGHPSGMTNLRTRLRLEAWVRNDSYAKTMWIDVHVLARGAELVHTETLPLRYARGR